MGSGITQTTGDHGWQDPRTGLWFENESIARSLGYGQPVNVGATIVQVGSQGSFTKDGKLVTEADLKAAGANNAGYVDAAAVNLQQNPTSDAVSAYNSLLNYRMNGSFTDPYADYVRPVVQVATKEDLQPAMTIGPSGVGSPVSPSAWKTIKNFTSPVQAAADQSINTGGLTTVGGIIAKYGAYIVMGIIIIVGLIFLSKGKVSHHV